MGHVSSDALSFASIRIGYLPPNSCHGRDHIWLSEEIAAGVCINEIAEELYHPNYPLNYSITFNGVSVRHVNSS